MILKDLREARGITQKQLAMDLGIRDNTISRYETGEREPDQTTLLKIAEYFHVTTDYLLTGQKEKPSKKMEGDVYYSLADTMRAENIHPDDIEYFIDLQRRARERLKNDKG